VTILFLHAFPLDASMWREVIDALAPRFRTLALELRGSSVEAMADDAAALLDAHGVAMAAVCGLSMGGYVALAFAERHAARMAALVLADTRAAADSPEARRGRDAGIASLRNNGVATFVEPLIARLLSPAADESMRARVLEIALRRSADDLIAALTALRDRPDRTAIARSLHCPTLLLAGSDDALSPPAEMRELARAIPAARFGEIPDAGHLTALENPAEFARSVGEFLNEV
jgi:pimeloyl-ACP methyl ester carboxylesterase